MKVGLPIEQAVTIALRTQQIIAHESGISDTVDPFAGSYVIEKMTLEIEEKVEEYLKKIDELGGMVKAIEIGYPQQEILNTAYRTQRRIEEKEEIIVGVNEYKSENDEKIEILKLDEDIEKKQKEQLRALKTDRNQKEVYYSLERLKKLPAKMKICFHML